jgi:hypothetical protein
VCKKYDIYSKIEKEGRDTERLRGRREKVIEVCVFVCVEREIQGGREGERESERES